MEINTQRGLESKEVKLKVENGRQYTFEIIDEYLGTDN